MAEKATSLKVFVSYSRVDVGFADQLVLALEDKGFDAILDRHDISGAENWRERLGKLILSADAVAFVLTAKSAASEICAWEVEEAKRLGKRLIPLTPEPLGAAKPPAVLGELNWIPFHADPAIPGSGFYYGVKRLNEALSIDLDWLRAQTRYSERTLEWAKDKREDLLLRGEALKEAEGWLARTPAGSHPPDGVREYLAASGDAEQRRQAAAKAQVEEREQALKAAEAAIAERQAAIAAKTKTDRLVRLLAVSSVAVGLVLVTAALVGLWYAARNYADAAERNAALFAREANALTSQGDKTLAMLVALSGDPAARNGMIESWMKPGGYPAAREALARAYGTNRMISRVATGEPVTAMTALFDGKRFVSFHRGGKARLWESGSPEPLKTFDVNGDFQVTEGIVVGLEQVLLVWGALERDTYVPTPPPQVLDLTTGQLGQAYGTGSYAAVSVDHDAGTILLSAVVNHVEERGLDDGQLKNEWRTHEDGGSGTPVWVGRLGDTLLTADSYGVISSWTDSVTRKTETTLNSVGALSGTTFDDMLILGGENGRIYGFSSGDMGDYQVFGQETGVAKIVTGGEGSMILISHEDKAAMYRDNLSSLTSEFGSGADVHAAVFLANGQMAATGSARGEVSVWSLAKGFEQLYPRQPLSRDQSLWGASLTADGGRAALDMPGTGKNALWTRGETTADERLNARLISRDGTLIVREVSPADDPGGIETFEIVRVDDGQVVHTVDAETYAAPGFLPNGYLVLSTHADESLFIWEVGADAPVRTIARHPGYSLSFSSTADGKLIAVSSNIDVAVFEAGKPEAIQRIPVAGGATVTFHPDGQRLAIGEDTGRLTLWRVGSPEPVELFSGHPDTITAITFNKDGTLMATGTWNGAANLWRLGQQESMQAFDTTGMVFDIAFDPDGGSVVMATEMGISRWTIEEATMANAETQVKLTCELLSKLGIKGFTQADVLALPILRGRPTDPCAAAGFGG